MNDLLTANFRRAEFACQCRCGFDAVDVSLVTGLQALRDLIGRPIEILSGCRCKAQNAAVGGAVHSRHVFCKAADIRFAGMTARTLYTAAAEIAQFHDFGVDDERGFVHVDVREAAARWCYSSGREAP